MRFEWAAKFSRRTLGDVEGGKLERDDTFITPRRVNEDDDGRNVIRGVLEEMPGWNLIQLEMRLLDD